jgi:osmoprotectant transport system permease protein
MYIFRGLRQNDNNLIIAGALAAALLALLCDFLIGRVEKSYAIGEPHSSRRWLVPVTAILLLVIAPMAAGWLTPTAVSVDSNGPAKRSIVVGSKDFTESVILAEILSQMLEKEGFTVVRKFELGGNLAHDSLLSKQVDTYPEYTGTAYTAILKHQPITDPQAVYDQSKAEYLSKFGLDVSPPLGFSNDFAILVRGEVARQNNLKTISDAVPISNNWQAGFGQDFMSRADGYPGFVRAYGFHFAKQPREMDLSLTYRALRSGELDIIAGNSTDGLISALDLYQLVDDKHYFPPYQAVFITRAEIAGDLNAAFTRLANTISTEEMRKMNYSVDGLGRTPKDVAAEWLGRFPAGE